MFRSRPFQRVAGGKWFPAGRLFWVSGSDGGMIHSCKCEWDQAFATDEAARQYAQRWWDRRLASIQ